MSKLPLVSVLIPLFNSEKYLPATLKSVLTQTYPNIEVIIVDDGSTDNSLNIAKSFEAKNDNIKVYQQINTGACAARNKAFELSCGDYIQFLDADDVLDKEKILQQVSVLEKLYDSSVIATATWDTFSNNIYSQDSTKKVRLLYKDLDPIEWLTLSWKNYEMMPPHVFLLSRKLVEITGSWDECLHKNQDGDFFFRAFINAKKIICVPEAKVYYRLDNPFSIGKSHSRIHTLSYLKSLIKQVGIIEEQRLQDVLFEPLSYSLSKFIIIYHNTYPDLTETAFRQLDRIGEGFKPRGRILKLLVPLIGIEKALILKSSILDRR